MKITLLSRLALAASLLWMALPATAEPLTVVTYNLRYASTSKPNAWPDRRPLMKESLHQIKPDIIGTQEGLYHQLKDLAADLPDYEWIGLGREGGSKGEFMAVFYRRDRLDPLEYDHYWLSDTPLVISSASWGNNVKRMVTWVRFKDLKTGKQFYLVNTHFDHESQPAREKSAALLRQKVADWNTTLPIILTGDFNAAAGRNPAHAALVEGGFFKDTWDSAKKRKGDITLNTFTGFQPVRRESQRIDWILTRGPVEAHSIEIIEFSKNGQYPSDHFPVVAELELAE